MALRAVRRRRFRGLLMHYHLFRLYLLETDHLRTNILLCVNINGVSLGITDYVLLLGHVGLEVGTMVDNVYRGNCRWISLILHVLYGTNLDSSCPSSNPRSDTSWHDNERQYVVRDCCRQYVPHAFRRNIWPQLVRYFTQRRYRPLASFPSFNC